jgi:hypothetical protein
MRKYDPIAGTATSLELKTPKDQPSGVSTLVAVRVSLRIIDYLYQEPELEEWIPPSIA